MLPLELFLDTQMVRTATYWKYLLKEVEKCIFLMPRGSFTRHNVHMIHPLSRVSQFIPFYC